jgi:hypothetical protein
MVKKLKDIPRERAECNTIEQNNQSMSGSERMLSGMVRMFSRIAGIVPDQEDWDC